MTRVPLSPAKGAAVVYLRDPLPGLDPDRLRDQLRAMRQWTGARPVDGLIVDLGSSRDANGHGVNLGALIRAGATTPGADVVILAGGLHHLADDEAGVSDAMAALLLAGFVLADASGELHPSPATTALAVRAAKRSPAVGVPAGEMAGLPRTAAYATPRRRRKAGSPSAVDRERDPPA